MYLGIRTFRAKRKDPTIPVNNKGLLGSYVSAFLLALTNPVTFFAFVAVFAAFGLGHKLNFISACILVLGVFTGSCLWFLTLGFVATLFRKKLDAGGLRWVNKISGVLIILSGRCCLREYDLTFATINLSLCTLKRARSVIVTKKVK